MRFISSRWRRVSLLSAAAVVAIGVVTFPVGQASAYADVQVVTDHVKGTDGNDYWVQNHLVQSDLRAEAAQGSGSARKEWLLVWAGDENVADTAVGDVNNLPGTLSGGLGTVRNALPGPDFLAVIDATKGSPTYGKVVNTATVGPLVENEPHHMEYAWHKGDTIFAGGLYSAATYAFDATQLPALRLKGISLPTQTLGGSVPDAFWVLKDGTAYGTYMGGPVVPGPYRYDDGSIAVGNGFAGTPGEIVHFDQNGKVLSQSPAATPQGDDPKICDDLPDLGQPSCANPHGIQAREDLNTLVTSDYAEPRDIILNPIKAPSPYLRRPTVRIFDISDRNHPKLRAVSYLPEGPRSSASDPLHDENRAAMETTVTNLPGHKGAFAETMAGGAVFYTPDITSPKPVWREIFDDGTALNKLYPGNGANGASSNGGWLQTSPDDHYLYHSLIGRPKGTLGPSDPGTTGGVYRLDISKLLSDGGNYNCDVTTLAKARDGGGGDCPALAGFSAINPGQSGQGPHWGALDNFQLGSDGYYHETDQPSRLAVSDYFVARTGLDGDHKVWLVNVNPDGSFSVDNSFRDEITGQPGVDFNRTSWPHGDFGNAKPHSELFVVADSDVK
ncbi:MAG TPA: hypothetical protein VG317_17155 [Pseudonocardiaceae bacterium]|nr:hypothetical protein [Pseudonocardiaceae bacterium]